MTVRSLTRRRVLCSQLAVGGVAVTCGGQGVTSSLPEPSNQPVTIRAFIGGTSGTMLDRWNPEIASPLKQQRPNLTLELVPSPRSRPAAPPPR